MQSPIASTTCEVKPKSETIPAASCSEMTFYERHGWCMNAFPTIREVMGHLRDELNASRPMEEEWQQAERLTNVFMLSCAVSDTVDDYLGGPQYDFSQAVGVFGPSRLVVRPLNRAVQVVSQVRVKLLKGLSVWRDAWETALARNAEALAKGGDDAKEAAGLGRALLLPLLDHRFPASLLRSRPRIPAAFRSQDLTHFDGFELARKFVRAYPDRGRPIVVVGLRTAGSYFAPLVRGYLASESYKHVTSLTLRPKRGVGLREQTCLAQAANQGALAIVIDEPVWSASTVAKGLNCLKKSGFHQNDIVALFPTHPNRTDWKTGAGSLALGSVRVLTLEPEEWYKRTLLENETACRRIRDYLEAGGRVTAVVKSSSDAERFTTALEDYFEPGMHWRLKRIYEVELRDGQRSVEKRFILAKSVGWGWLGYHAFLAGIRLAEFVPQVLGLRDGILYMEWATPARNMDSRVSREHFVEFASSYLAGRVRTLGLVQNPTADLVRAGRHRGTEELAGLLSAAYGWKIASALKRPRIQQQLAKLNGGAPTLIDGKMRRLEWVETSGRLLKTDFEHHGMGKHELNLVDPAYDLAEVVLHAQLSEDEEQDLVQRYTECSGDKDIAGRLFLYKLLAGSWAMARAADNLKQPSIAHRHDHFNERFLEANRFLTIHTTRFCAAMCQRPLKPHWSEPLVVLDVDGVLDKQVFGFPSTSSDGIKALSLLASHGRTVALNTARSVSEMKEYCKAYGFVGGVAEYGGFAWNAISGREQVLVSPESLDQMKRLREALKEIPGVFLNDDYRLIVRAHVYARGTMVPLPEGVVRGLMASLKLDRLRLHQTYTDSTVTAAEVDKGTGLNALLLLAGRPGLETVAVGDSEPDLAMFRTATRCFAPGQIGCPQPARLLGCRIASRPYQSGLLEIVRSLVHPKGGSCPQCRLPEQVLRPGEEIFMHMLRMSDRSRVELLVRSLFDHKAIDAFRQ